MKCLFLLIGMALLGSGARAQTAGDGSPPEQFGTERRRIEVLRSSLQAGFKAEDAFCQKKFAVNSCLADVDARRRQAMADLRRQEIGLNERERKLKGEQQLRKIEDKAIVPAPPGEAASAGSAAERPKQGRQIDKQLRRAKTQAREPANAATAESKAVRNRQKAAQRAARADQEAQATEAFNRRQREAEERRAANQRAKLERAKPAAKPLPIPP
jgi:colicin import membrane protein